MSATSTTSRFRRVVLSAASVVLMSGCAGDGEEPSTRRVTQGKAGAVTVNDYDPGNFSDPTNVDNPYSP
ncbi:MAG TPA: hypothetical protein VHI54_10600, partial [Actinomycetota bacterium]|nr:hypothetical protein [Actinomycetota bacterium]